MTIEDDVAVWVSGRPAWQQDVLAQLAGGQEFTDEDIEGLVDRVLDSERSHAGRDPVLLTVPRDADEKVQLVSVSNVSGVNALLDDETLDFGQDGLTVVYGDNGSGKSGYARLIKSMIRTRHEEPVLPNAFGENLVAPSAEMSYTVAGVASTQKLGEPFAPPMQRMAFYDDDCGEMYITTASSVSYRPSALSLLDGLISVCDRVVAALKLKRELLEANALQLDVPGDTAAAKFVDRLTAQTTERQIEDAIRLKPSARDDLNDARADETRLLSMDPNTEKARLTGLAGMASDLGAHLDGLLAEFTADRIEQLVSVKLKVAQLREVADIAAQKAFEDVPLTGVGSDTWRTLWEAARAYSETNAYHDHEFPRVNDDARCVLSQQPLSRSASTRMSDFERFVRDTTAQDADAAEKTYRAHLERLQNLVVESVDHMRAVADVTASDADLGAAVLELLDVIEKARVSLVARLSGDGERPSPVSGGEIRDRVDRFALQLHESAEALDVDEFSRILNGASRRRAELEAGIQVHDAEARVRGEVARLQQLDGLAGAIKAANTAVVTRKVTDLTRQYVTEEIQRRFQAEVERFGLRNVSMVDLGGHKGHLRQQPQLDDVGLKDVTAVDVLSEGEQTVLGLAGFLTEAAIEPSKSAIVFDDPVTSLDHLRRATVARRIIELAKDRQVVVFTHDVSFVVDLSRYAEEEKLQFHGRAIERRGPHPGACSSWLPWKAKSLNERVHHLGNELARLRRERENLTTSEWEAEVGSWAGQLSEAWERCIRLEIVDQLFDPSVNEKRPMKLRLLVHFMEEDNDEYQTGYSWTSRNATRHDKARETNYSPPESREMEGELERLTKWRDRVKQYKNKRLG